MKVVFSRRAEVAFRSLRGAEHRRVAERVAQLRAAATVEDLPSSIDMRQLNVGRGEPLYSCRAAGTLRLVLSVRNDDWTIEDIVDHEAIEGGHPGRDGR